MRITLSQDELFEAISDYVRGKMNLDSAASIGISLTAGRSPKGYTADVDITYPKSDLAAKIVATESQDDASDAMEAPAATNPVPSIPGVPDLSTTVADPFA